MRRGNDPKPGASYFLDVHKRRRDDWALESAIEKLGSAPGFTHLFRCNLLTVCEFRAGRILSKHWGRLPQDAKVKEMHALRKLLAGGFSHCLLSLIFPLVCGAGQKAPLQKMAGLTAAEFSRLEERARDASDNSVLAALERQRNQIDQQIKKLKRKKAA